MSALLVQLAALVPLLGSPAQSADDPRLGVLERSSIAVTDGIVGGISGARPCVLLEASFDRVKRCFRVVRRRGTGRDIEVYIGELEPAQFRALLDLAVEARLTELPMEDPPGCTDVYQRGRQIRLDYGQLQWANGAPGGCIASQSKVVPTQDELRRFDQLVERLELAVDELPLNCGSLSDLAPVPYLADAKELDSYRRVMQHVRHDPLRHKLDLERVGALESRIIFLWRGRGPSWPTGDCEYVVDAEGNVQRVAPRGIGSDGFEPMETGMTLEAVVARLGEPDTREERPDGALVLTYSTYRAPYSNRPPSRPTVRLRFEGGRLSAP